MQYKLTYTYKRIYGSEDMEGGSGDVEGGSKHKDGERIQFVVGRCLQFCDAIFRAFEVEITLGKDGFRSTREAKYWRKITTSK